MSDSTLDRLDEIAHEISQGNVNNGMARLDVLSRAERLYTLLAANRADLLGSDSIAYALRRMGRKWVDELMLRHEYD